MERKLSVKRALNLCRALVTTDLVLPVGHLRSHWHRRQEGAGQQAKSKYSFAFRCHRDGAMIYPVNAIDTHPAAEHQAAFVTAGADGTFSIWDKDKRTRYKEVKNVGPTPITSILWNPQGDLLAYSKGYDWSKGAEGYDVNQHPTKLFVQWTLASRDLVVKA